MRTLTRRITFAILALAALALAPAAASACDHFGHLGAACPEVVGFGSAYGAQPFGGVGQVRRVERVEQVYVPQQIQRIETVVAPRAVYVPQSAAIGVAQSQFYARQSVQSFGSAGICVPQGAAIAPAFGGYASPAVVAPANAGGFFKSKSKVKVKSGRGPFGLFGR